MTGSSVTRHQVGGFADGAGALVVTADGAAWCVLGAAGVVVRLAPEGTRSRIELDSATAEPHSVAGATRDSVWVTDRGSDRILRIDASGVVWSAVVPTPHSGVAGIVGLDDGSAWFVEEASDAVGRVDILGRVTEFDTGVPGGAPASIASDGSSVWFALPGAGAIAHARGGDSLPGLQRFDDPLAAPVDVSIADDGCLWFADPARRVVGRLGRGGAVHEFAMPWPSVRPVHVAPHEGGGCWFTMEGADGIGHVDSAGLITAVAVPGGAPSPVAIALSESGELWLALESGVIVQLHDPGSLSADIQ